MFANQLSNIVAYVQTTGEQNRNYLGVKHPGMLHVLNQRSKYDLLD